MLIWKSRTVTLSAVNLLNARKICLGPEPSQEFTQQSQPRAAVGGGGDMEGRVVAWRKKGGPRGLPPGKGGARGSPPAWLDLDLSKSPRRMGGGRRVSP